MSNELVTTSNELPAGASSDDLPSWDHQDFSVSYDPGRKAEIERIRDTDIERYFSEGLDREMLQILRAEMGETTPTDPMDPETSRSLLSVSTEGRELVRSWDSLGGFKMQLQRLQSQVGGLVKGLGSARHQQAFMERFDRSLSEGTRYQIYEALSMGLPSFVQPATAEMITEFKRGGPIGDELLSEWGSWAPERIAIIWKRVDMLKQQIGDEAMEDFKAWFGALSDLETKAVLRFVAEGAR